MINIDVVTKSKKWLEEENSEKFIKETCEKLIPLTDLKTILNKNFAKGFELELSISLVSDTQIKKINSQFRNKNKATNVLSFPALDENLVRKIGLKKLTKSTKYLFLGDIIIAYETVKKESLAQKKKFRNHLTHLILHSILHLIGFDHEDEKMAKEMESLEIKILKKLNIANPYLIDK
ncbi:MAG: rRNA maturation RNase YbeY [Rickettsiales bacterium]|nr:rRNA maturation RNase YbeY [Rickettsiales bacterium]